MFHLHFKINGNFRLILLLKLRQKSVQCEIHRSQALTIKNIIMWHDTVIWQTFTDIRGTYCLHPQDWRISPVSKQVSRKQSTLQPLKIMTVNSSETLVNLYQTTQHHITEDTTLYNQNNVWDKMNYFHTSEMLLELLKQFWHWKSVV
jgi:hypothetical protein